MVTAAELIAEARSNRVSKVLVMGREFFVLRLGGDVVMSITQRAREGKPLAPHEWLTLGVVNEDGSPFFTDAEAAEYFKEDGLAAVMLSDAVADKAGFGKVNAAKN